MAATQLHIGVWLTTSLAYVFKFGLVLGLQSCYVYQMDNFCAAKKNQC